MTILSEEGCSRTQLPLRAPPPRGMKVALKYSTVMPGGHGPTRRWQALDITARLARLQHSLTCSPGPIANALSECAVDAAHVATGLWKRDPTVWASDRATQESIARRLGWMEAPALMADNLTRLDAFADQIRQSGLSRVVLLGMGGSSLAPEVLRAIVGVAPAAPCPRFHVLDSTDPGAVLAVHPPFDRTLFILASKSGTTIEPNSLAAHFRQALLDAGHGSWADRFVAITDEGTDLAARARAEGFHDLFINPSDIGGRYSALSLFGLVPATLMGQDVRALVGWGLAMLASGPPNASTALEHPAVGLGMMMGAAARVGRDKLTLLLPMELEPFGMWVEQLVAESTGKSGVGVIPISGETVTSPEEYGEDRLFVHVRLSGSRDRTCTAAAEEIRTSGAPLAILEVDSVSNLGAEFSRWEIATAVAGGLLGINPFDEPNVQQAKDATRTLLASYGADGRFRTTPPHRTTPEGVELRLTTAALSALGTAGPEDFLTLIAPKNYAAILAYLGPDEELAASLHVFRMVMRDHTRAATMFGYGPRYLHSTGQLHKGGPNTGVFILITATPREDVPIPGASESFGILEQAQALGDFASLDATGRRALQIHLPTPERRLLQPVLESLLDRIGGRGTS